LLNLLKELIINLVEFDGNCGVYFFVPVFEFIVKFASSLAYDFFDDSCDLAFHITITCSTSSSLRRLVTTSTKTTCSYGYLACILSDSSMSRLSRFHYIDLGIFLADSFLFLGCFIIIAPHAIHILVFFVLVISDMLLCILFLLSWLTSLDSYLGILYPAFEVGIPIISKNFVGKEAAFRFSVLLNPPLLLYIRYDIV
jgi:hypothetical protein